MLAALSVKQLSHRTKVLLLLVVLLLLIINGFIFCHTKSKKLRGNEFSETLHDEAFGPLPILTRARRYIIH